MLLLAACTLFYFTCVDGLTGHFKISGLARGPPDSTLRTPEVRGSQLEKHCDANIIRSWMAKV